MLVEAYGDHALSEATCKRWFQRFRDNDFDVRNEERGRSPKKYEDAELQAILDEDETLNQYFEVYDVLSQIIPDFQHGFMKGRSTTTNLLDTSAKLFKGMDKIGKVDIIYFDLTKALAKISTPLNVLELIFACISNRQYNIHHSNTTHNDSNMWYPTKEQHRATTVSCLL